MQIKLINRVAHLKVLPLKLQKLSYYLCTSYACLIPSPIKVNSSTIKVILTTVGIDIHHASRLALACDNITPKLGVVCGSPKPKKSSAVNTTIPWLILKGNKVIIGVITFGIRC